jgi:pimeloyl-ACP methyl ester carboxylesterase
MTFRALAFRTAGLALAAALACPTGRLTAQTPPPPAKRLPPAGVGIPAAARAELVAGAAQLRREIDALPGQLAQRGQPQLRALLPDVEIFHKAVDWPLRYDEFFDAKQVAAARKAIATGQARAAELAAGRAPWLEATGLIVRGYRSELDGSIQPYGLVVPANLPRGQPSRLLVWLLGRGDKRSELAFIAEREAGPAQLTPKDTITLVPYGRFCNATKFAGEVDVFEALAAVRAQYRIDPDRMTVAGFSMGGASVWHLATHHAGLWCAASPGAGFAETAIYNKALAPGKPPRTPWEQTLWRWYDATEYAGNLFNLPLVAYSGEIDPQKQSADLMEAAMAREGLKLERLIGPQTAHKYHPATKQELTTRLEALADRGRDARPREIHLTTYTLRYPGESWVRLEGLERHWERADVRARLEDNGNRIVGETKNVAALHFESVRPDGGFAGTVTLDGQTLQLGAQADPSTLLVRTQGKWAVVRRAAYEAAPRKRPGLTGPIDDAFMAPFVFVRPGGTPLNAKVGAWAAAEFAHATKMWRDIFRGDAPVKDAADVTADDIASRNLVLWGDPASNALLARLLPSLPLQWDAHGLVFRGKKYDAATHAPVLIFPNPLNPKKYIVLNSGIDFRDEAYGTNSLQTPKLPDFAVIDLREAPGPRWPGKIVDAGFFDEAWKE